MSDFADAHMSIFQGTREGSVSLQIAMPLRQLAACEKMAATGEPSAHNFYRMTSLHDLPETPTYSTGQPNLLRTSTALPVV